MDLNGGYGKGGKGREGLSIKYMFDSKEGRGRILIKYMLGS